MSSNEKLSWMIHAWSPPVLKVFAKLVFCPVAVFSLALSAPALAAQPAVLEAPLQLDSGLLMIPVRINGHTFTGFYDSGANASALSSAAVKELGLTAHRGGSAVGFGGRTKISKLHDIRFEFGNGGFTFRTIVVVDFAQLSASVGRRVDFSFGSDAHLDHVIELDFQSLQIRWTPRHQFVPPSGAFFARMTGHGGDYCIPMSVNGVTGIAKIDTGSDTPLTLAHDFALRAGIDPTAGASGQSTGVGGKYETRRASAPHADLGGVALNDLPAKIVSGRLPEHGVDINLGLPVLSRYHVYLDYGHRELWLTPLADAGTAPFERDLAGLTVGDGGSDRLVVRFVSDRGPARAAGLTGGEEITAIDGVAVWDWLADQPIGADWWGPEGATRTLTLADGRTITLTLARYY